MQRHAEGETPDYEAKVGSQTCIPSIDDKSKVEVRYARRGVMVSAVPHKEGYKNNLRALTHRRCKQ